MTFNVNRIDNSAMTTDQDVEFDVDLLPKVLLSLSHISSARDTTDHRFPAGGLVSNHGSTLRLE